MVWGISSSRKRVDLILSACLAWSSIVLAGGAADWSSQYNARLSQALGSEPSEAIAVYEALLAQLPQQNPQRGDVLYWLGRARWSAGDLAGAKQSLESARGYRSSRPRARTLGRIQKTKDSYGPVSIRFSTRYRALARGWELREDDLTVHDGPGGRVVRWAQRFRKAKMTSIFGLDADGAKIRSFR